MPYISLSKTVKRIFAEKFDNFPGIFLTDAVNEAAA